MSSPSPRRRWLRAIVRVAGVALLVATAAHFLRAMDWRGVGAALLAASLPLLVAAVGLNLVQVLVRALCFGVLLAPVRRVGALRLCRYLLAMYAANNLLPGRAGEVVRVFLLKRREGVPASTAVSVSLCEKALDAAALALLALPLPLLSPSLPRTVARTIGLLGAIGIVALAAAAIVARAGRARVGRIGDLARGAAALSRPGPFVAALGLTLAAYAMDAAQVALCLAAVGAPVSLAAPSLVLLAMAVVRAVPSTPGAIGAMEVGAVAALHLLGVAPERALAFGVLYHATQSLPVTLLGLDGLRLASMARGATAPDRAPAAVAADAPASRP